MKKRIQNSKSFKALAGLNIMDQEHLTVVILNGLKDEVNVERKFWVDFHSSRCLVEK